MLGNTKRRTFFHASRQEKSKRGGGGGMKMRAAWTVLFALVIAAAAVFAVAATYLHLRGLYKDQCKVTDLARQVKVDTGGEIRESAIIDKLGIKEGLSNLAEIDFDEKRAKILKDIPSISDITITRFLPDRVEIKVEGRIPVARLLARGDKSAMTVVDEEGVVFRKVVSASLPVIVEGKGDRAKQGTRLSGRKLAALRMVRAIASDEFWKLAVRDIDTSPADYLTITLRNYHRVKICWEGMDNPTAETEGKMRRQLKCLLAALDANVAVTTPGAPPLTWNATIPDIVTVDTKEPIQ